MNDLIEYAKSIGVELQIICEENVTIMESSHTLAQNRHTLVVVNGIIQGTGQPFSSELMRMILNTWRPLN